MGEVYRATDTNLGRDVAIKVLPAAVAQDKERLARFEREAKLLASLNHPSIAHVYGFESATLPDGSAAHFLAMELVPGEDLAERLKRGPLPVGEALQIAKQIAEALEEAHEKGIVHRDLKPANVKLTPEARVKVLDFGLAKAYAEEPASGSAADLSQSPTLAHTGTQAGVILGTAAYMSPEQARGKTVDKRADIWSFGVVLFEMLTGKRLFDGETVSDVLAAVLTREPGWSALPPTTPGACLRLLRRCLERDPRQRLRDIGEARITLASVNPNEPVPSPARRLRRPVIAALALAAVGFLAGSWLRPRPSPEAIRKLDIADEHLEAAGATAPVLSPDGARVLYFTKDGLRVRELDQAEARNLEGTQGARYAFWSPDGREIGFHKDDALYRVNLEGGAPQIIARTGPAVGGAGACWGTDGRVVYSLGNTALFEVSARGGEPRVLLAPDPAQGEDHFHGCSFLPGGHAFVWVIHSRDAPADTLALFENGRSRVILKAPADQLSHPACSLSGHIVFDRRGAAHDGVWALPFSLSRLEPTGEPFLIAPDAKLPSVAADGSLLYVPARPPRPVELVWVSRSGQSEGTAVEFPDEVAGMALSRDGKRVAAAVGDPGGSDLWVADLERGSRTRLTFGAGTVGGPAWSPDGTRVAFDRNNQIFVVPADGSSEPRAVGRGLQPFFDVDGRTILAHRPHPGAGRSLFEIVSLDATGEREPDIVLSDAVSVRYPLLSPDGRLLAYDRGDGDEVESFLTRFPEVKGRWQVSATGGTFLRWSPDGRRLFYIAPTPGDSDPGLFEVEVRPGAPPSLGVPRLLFTLSAAGAAAQEYEVGPSGDRFLMLAREQAHSLPRLLLVQNWLAEVRDEAARNERGP
jgi:tRNA A-37 threonylcarbamoyl transferase component Bud32